MPSLSLVTLTFAFYRDIQTGDQTRFPVNLMRAGQHRAHLQLVDTGRGQGVVTLIGNAGRHLNQNPAAITGHRRGPRLRPVVWTATRCRVLTTRLVVRLLVVDAVVRLRSSRGTS